jgi:hypothetical protein
MQRKSISIEIYLILSKNKMKTEDFAVTLNNRVFLAQWMEHLTLEQLNKIPDGFSNNILWNIGHIIVVQQMLTYHLSGLKMHIPETWIPLFKRGTRPESNYSQEEADAIRNALIPQIEQTQKDAALGVFKNYHPFTSASGFTMTHIQDAIAFNNFNEGIHFGVILQLKKRV